MKAILLPILAYFYFFRPAAAAPSPEQQEYIDYCVKNYGPNVTIKPAEDGGYLCVICAGAPYDDPVTGDRKCCTRLNEKFTVDKVVKTQGGCCKPPLVYAYDPVAKAGKCCGSSQTFKDGECIPPFPLPPKCAPCSKNYVCACDGDLGLQYGHCYTMTDVNGLQFNRAVDGTYQSGGDIGNLIFRVCKSTADCDADMGKYVPDDGTWVLQDQLGQRGDNGPGWFGNQSPHMGIAARKDINLAAIFKGEGYCMFGDCAICLRLSGAPDKGLSAPCPMGASAEMAHIGPAANPLNCKAYRFQEIKCVKGVPAKFP